MNLGYPISAFSGFFLLIFAGICSFYRASQLFDLHGAIEPKPQKRTLVIFVLLLTASMLLLCSSRYRASELSISDSVEYVSAAIRLVTEGRYDLQIGNVSYPPRYSPWFSLWFLAPVYKLFGLEPGNGIIIEWASILAILLSASMLSLQISGVWAAVLAPVLILGVPGFRYFSAQIMTDIPASALGLLLCLLYVAEASRARKENESERAWLPGILLAFAVSLRPTMISFALPFIWGSFCSRINGPKIFAIFSLLLPCLLVLLSTLLYNNAQFGSLMRSGYNYWVPIPYDFFSLTFGSQFLITNLKTALDDAGFGFLVFLIAISPLIRSKAFKQNGVESLKVSEHKAFLKFVLLAGLPQVLFYLFYFYSTPRFYLPITSLLMVAVAISFGAILNRTKVSIEWAASLFAIGALVWVLTISNSQNAKSKRRAIEEIIAHTPPDSVIISGLDPVYTQTLLHSLDPKSQRIIVPISRRVEFASKVVSAKVLSGEAPHSEDLEVLRNIAKERGAKDVVAETALENSDYISGLLAQNKLVYLSSIGALDSELSTFKKIANLRMVLNQSENIRLFQIVMER